MTEQTPKPDLIIAAVTGMRWDQIRPFANSIVKSGFHGETVILVHNMDSFTQDCLRAREFTVVPFSNPTEPTNFITKYRFVQLLKFLKKYGQEYRYVIWVDAGDQVFQLDPSPWLESRLGDMPGLVVARECWKIKQEQQWNVPWVKATTPDDFEWLQHQEICCGGTIAGDVATMTRTIEQILQMVDARPDANDQAALNYIFHRPFNFPSPTRTLIPTMSAGWTATCSAFDTPGFKSLIGIPVDQLTDIPPIFDTERELVLTPDGKTPFVLVHQYNRDDGWTRIMHTKYGDIR
jgi:hypothetical protein